MVRVGSVSSRMKRLKKFRHSLLSSFEIVLKQVSIFPYLIEILFISAPIINGRARGFDAISPQREISKFFGELFIQK